jgi:light-regulated signal transduction histidine kinase (bacteriophytochrome)
LPDEVSSSWAPRLKEVFGTGVEAGYDHAFSSSGGPVYYFTQLVPEFDDQGKVRSVLSITRNITELKEKQSEISEMNESLKARNRQLRQYNKELASLETVTSSDLKEPLKRIYTSIELLIRLEGNKLSDTGKAHFRRIQSAVQKMGLMTDDLLSFVRLCDPDLCLDMQPVDLNLVLKEAMRQLEEPIKKTNARIVSATLPEVTGNQPLLVWLFQQLLHNAIKFQPPGQSPGIVISTEMIVKTDTGRSTVLKEWIKVTFSDNGIGFDEAYKPKLFQLFSKLPGHEQFRGSGMGLALCRKIMEIHQGSIHAERNGLQGATFYCCFPSPASRSATGSLHESDTDHNRPV